MLAFEKELIAWSERDLRRIDPPPPGAERLPLDALRASLLRAHPDARPGAIVVQRDPLAAVAFTSGRAGGYYVNPYTGDVRPAVAGRMSAFMHTMTDLHRTLGFHGEESRVVGKMINGVCNLAYFVLALTGLYLWMPRRWSWQTLRPVIWFRGAIQGKARDFNWHNTLGFWTAPIVMVLTLTAVPISFRWGGEFIYWITGTPAPAAESRGPGAAAPSVELPAPAPGARPLSTDALVASVQQREPDWKTLTLRLSGAAPGGRGERGGAARPRLRRPRFARPRQRDAGRDLHCALGGLLAAHGQHDATTGSVHGSRGAANGSRRPQCGPACSQLDPIPAHWGSRREGGTGRRRSGLSRRCISCLYGFHAILEAILWPQVGCHPRTQARRGRAEEALARAR